MTYKGVPTDIYFWTAEDDHMTINTYYAADVVEGWVGSNCFKQNRELVSDFEWLEFGGVRLPYPKNYDAILTANYGDWRVPNSRWNYMEMLNKDRKADRPHSGRSLSEEEVLRFETGNHI